MKRENQNTTPRSVLVLVGSGRKQRGATYAAAQRLVEELESSGDVRGEVLFLSEYDFGLCRGCKACFERGEERCPLSREDRDLLVEKMLAADGVVFASPNYSFGVSGVMKVFLDRLGYLFHRPRFHGKTFSAIVVQGIYGGTKVQKYLEFVGSGLGFDVVKGSCITALEPMTDKAQRRMERSIAAQARRLRRQLLKPDCAPPSLFRLMIFRMARTSMRQMLDEGNRDHDDYRDHGWFESDYYYETSLGPFKRLAGAFFDWLFGRLYARPSPRSA